MPGRPAVGLTRDGRTFVMERGMDGWMGLYLYLSVQPPQTDAEFEK